MNYKTCYWDPVDKVQKERACTAEEIAEIEARKNAPAPAPTVVTMRQARIALLQAGLLDDVELAIDALTEDQRKAARIYWEYSSEIERGHEFTSMLAQAMNLNDAAVDALFITAGKL